MTMIECRQAAFGYDGNTVISGLDFQLNQGDYLCVVGENGAGKSTLIKGILQLISPYAGQVTMGKELNKQDIGYLPQQTAAQKDFPASVEEVVRSGFINRRGLRPFYTSTEKETANEWIQRLGIQTIVKKCYRELSGGQQQRVLLARALCATDKILLLDEPVSGLDPLASGELYQLVAMLNKEKGISIVMVSHDVQNAVEEASHILHLQQKQLFFGPVAEYVDSDLGKSFIGRRQHD